MWRRLDNVPRLNIHSAKTLTCGTPWSVAWGAYVSGCGGWWEAWRGQILRGASFALVWCREERGASASKAGNILVIQVIVAIVFEKREEAKFICGCLEHSLVATHLLGCTGAWLVEEWMPSGWVVEMSTATGSCPWSIKRPGICRRSDMLSQLIRLTRRVHKYINLKHSCNLSAHLLTRTQKRSKWYIRPCLPKSSS